LLRVGSDRFPATNRTADPRTWTGGPVAVMGVYGGGTEKFRAQLRGVHQAHDDALMGR